ncbi:MAG: methionine adenosyltransferase domain-containing protein [Clostridium sp.]|nr:methionine adenosyltransferase domain-containing protein [Clostridium sp.]
MRLFSNEIVFRGHPDKVCDQISDALLDEYIKGDKKSRCAIETVGGKGKIFITGEVTSNTKVNVEDVVKSVLKDVGYLTDYEIINNIGIQSKDIALGTNDEVLGAGDQGMMFGYACNDNIYYLPTAMVILKELSKEYDNLLKVDNRFKSDGKAQITGYYDENMKLIKIKTFTISYQNTEKERKSTDKIIIDICNNICSKYNIEVEEYLINPTGKFEIGGFLADAGLTGRKIVVDSYQGFAPVGGGAFSGKDPTKVDRSGAYKARLIAIYYLKKYNLKWCRVQLSYAIGIRKPLAIYIDSNKGMLNDEVTINKYSNLYEECEPKNIIDDLNLLNDCFYERSKFGHF